MLSLFDPLFNPRKAHMIVGCHIIFLLFLNTNGGLQKAKKGRTPATKKSKKAVISVYCTRECIIAMAESKTLNGNVQKM